MSEPKTIWTRIGRIDRRAIIWMLIITTFLAGIFPIQFPISVSEPTIRSYQAVDGLKPNSLVLIAVDFDAGMFASVGYQGVAIIRHLMQKEARIVFVSSYTSNAPGLTIMMEKQANIDSKYKYGVNYVNLGFVPGAETFVAAIAKDFRANVKTDVDGTPIDNLPALQGVKDAGSFSLVIDLTSSECVPWWARQWSIPYGVPLVAGATGATVTGVMPYYPNKGVVGYLNDVAGGGEYEALLKSPGEATRVLGMQNIAHMWWFFWMALGNIALVAETKFSRKNGSGK